MAKANIKMFVPAIIWAIIILILSSLSGSTMKQFDWSDIANIDKMGHLFFYAVLSFLTLFGFYKNGLKNISIRNILTSTIMVVSYGGLIEILQYSLIKGRYFDLLDFLANIIGCTVGIIIFMYLKNLRVWIFH